MEENPFILSDESVNSYGFIVKTAGIDLTRFKANPVMLHEHDTKNLIGRWKDVKTKGKQLIAVPEFDTDDTLGAQIAGKVERGFLKGASIGIHIVEMTMGENQVPVATKTELVEASTCALPSNANALRLYDKEGNQLTVQDVTTLLSAMQRPKPKPNSDMKLSETVLKALGLDANADEAAINAALEAKLKEAPKPDPKPEPKPEENAELKALTADMKAMRTERNEAQVDRAISEGRILASQKETYMAKLDADYSAGCKELAALPVRRKTSITELPKDEQGKDLKFDELRKTKEGYAQLMEIKRTDPERYKQLVAGSAHAKSFT